MTPHDPDITKGLRNGTEPIRLSAKSLANAEAKRYKASLAPGSIVWQIQPEQQAAWLAEQVKVAYLSAYREELEAE